MLLKREGWNVGKKLVYRLYREEGLALRYKPRRRRSAAANRRERSKATAPNQAWSLDFVSDELADGRRFRALTVVDVFTRECLAIEVGQSLKGENVVQVLSRICVQRGVPKTLYCDNGSEFTSQAMDLWAYHAGVQIDFSRQRPKTMLRLPVPFSSPDKSSRNVAFEPGGKFPHSENPGRGYRNVGAGSRR